jgi:S1-C subfamily serine protease
LISNYHVVKDATKVRLLTGLRRDEVASATQAGAGLIDAKVVQVDAANDLALLKADRRFHVFLSTFAFSKKVYTIFEAAVSMD